MIGDGLSVGGGFTGSISGTTLHVTAISSGVMLSPGQVIVAGIGAPIAIAAGTYIVQQLSGKGGGMGTYAISVSQTVVNEVQVARSFTIRKFRARSLCGARPGKLRPNRSLGLFSVAEQSASISSIRLSRSAGPPASIACLKSDKSWDPSQALTRHNKALEYRAMS